MSKVKTLASILDPQEILSPKHKSNTSLNTLLERRLDELTVSKPDKNAPEVLWPSSRYGLDQSSLFKSLKEEQAQKYLKRMTELNLSLSAFIETSGHNYGAKMILLSETLEEKSTYALFASDEAVHLREFQNFINFDYSIETHAHPMLNPLADAIKEGSKISLVFVIQVLLEGFGMSHYNGLRETCLYQPLNDTYDRILKDEARHHGTGVILAKEEMPTKEDQEQIFEYTRAFVVAMQSAHWLAETFEHIGVPLDSKQKQKLWEEIHFEQVLKNRLLKLKDMLKKVDSFGLIDMLEKDAVFKAQAS